MDAGPFDEAPTAQAEALANIAAAAMRLFDVCFSSNMFLSENRRRFQPPPVTYA
jgi:hypothetical protein